MTLKLASLMATSLLLVASHATASTYLDSFYGTPVDGGNARTLALGGVGVSSLQGSSALFQNPALLAHHQSGVQLDLMVGLNQVNEDRLVPLFDTFESFVTETTFAANRNTYGFGEGGVLFRLPLETPVTVATGLFERYDVGFDYFEEVRDPDRDFEDGGFRDEIIQFHELISGGQLRSWSTGFGAELIDGVSAGFSVHRYFGEFERMRRVAPVAGTASVGTIVRELSGWGWSVGGQGMIYERYSLGISFEGPVTVSGAHRARLDGAADPAAPEAGDYEIEYPGALHFGATFTPRNELRTQVSIQATRRFWEELDDSYLAAEAEIAGEDPAKLHDTWDLRFGLEHVFYNGTPLRFGFRHLGNYLDEEVYRSIFSIGVGQQVAGWSVDLTGQYHRQSSNQRYLFDPSVGQFTGLKEINEVQTTLVTFLVGASRGF